MPTTCFCRSRTNRHLHQSRPSPFADRHKTSNLQNRRDHQIPLIKEIQKALRLRLARLAERLLHFICRQIHKNKDQEVFGGVVKYLLHTFLGLQ